MCKFLKWQLSSSHRCLGRSRNSSVSIGKRPQTGWTGVWFPAGTRSFCSSNLHAGTVTHLTSPSQWKTAIFLARQCSAVHKADHAIPRTASMCEATYVLISRMNAFVTCPEDKFIFAPLSFCNRSLVTKWLLCDHCCTVVVLLHTVLQDKGVQRKWSF
jgi:hypothetical protein